MASAGFLAMAGATGSATTVHDTSFNIDSSQSMPVAVLLLWIVLVPGTAEKEGTVADHADHAVPLVVITVFIG